MARRSGRDPLDPFIDQERGRARFSASTAEAVELEEVEGLLAGAAEADITPPPGMPKAGYSSNAHDGMGFRTRLRARVVHLRAGRTSLAWVQCDLLGGSSILQHLVAGAIADRTDVPLAGVFIGATHTHAGPGQFLGTDFYNKFASNRGGFDPAYTHFLVEQIAGAVIEAVESRRPARLAVGSTEAWGFTRNRSLDPHVQNGSVDDKRLEPQRKWVSVNPQLHVLRVDALVADSPDTDSPDNDSPDNDGPDRYEPLSATVVFSVHGTGITVNAHEYNADLWAYLVDELSHRISPGGERGRVVVGAVQGSHADVAPAIRPGLGGHLEARRIGRGVGAVAAELYHDLGSELSDEVSLGAGLREIDLDRNRSIEGIELPKRPAVGAALVAGAHENLTPVVHRIPPFKAGSPKRHPAGPQAEKWVIGSRWLQPLFLPPKQFPRILPVQVLRIGDTVLLGMAFEVTVESGRRMETAVLEAVQGTGVERAIVSSVANEYSGYVATAEEYRRQFYEGGHTLYGPKTESFLTRHGARLAAEVVRQDLVADVGAERSWDLKVHRYLARPGGQVVERCSSTTPSFIDPTGTVDGYWQFEWTDVAPGDLAWHEPMVRVERRDPGAEWVPARSGDGRWADDQGCDVDVTHLGRSGQGHRYRTRWYEPSFRAGRSHRFVVLANCGQPEMTSPPFD